MGVEWESRITTDYSNRVGDVGTYQSRYQYLRLQLAGVRIDLYEDRGGGAWTCELQQNLFSYAVHSILELHL